MGSLWIWRIQRICRLQKIKGTLCIEEQVWDVACKIIRNGWKDGDIVGKIRS